MNFTRSLSTFPLLLAAAPALGFVPPLGPVANKIFQERHLPATAEILVKHRVEADRNPVEVEERIYVVNGRPRFLFRVGGKSFVATRDQNGYRFPSEVIETKNGLFLKALLSRRGEEFIERAIAEQFLRRDQLNQFKPSYGPSGDPKTWNTNASYIRHSDVELARLPQGTAILATNGGDAKNPARAIYFDRNLRGISRLEWRDGEHRYQWDFPTFLSYKREGTYPNRWVFHLDGKERVRSEVVSIRPVADRWVNEALRSAESPSDEAREVLTMLLGSR